MLEPIHFKIWFYVKSRDACIGIPAKCGGSSFYRNVFKIDKAVPDEHVRSAAVVKALDMGAGPFSTTELAEFFPDTERMLVIRNPVDRFYSLWRDKCRRSPATARSMEWLRGWTPDQLLRYIKQYPFGDPHWIPQYSYLVPRISLIGHDILPHLFGYSDIVNNKTKSLSTDPVINEEDIKQQYYHDCLLWEELNA